jgi:uncharacterized protein YndB with AHSA1/START domain
MKQESFIIERLLNAPAEKVWNAITDKKAMKQWYFDIAEFKPEVGFEFQFDGGNEDKVYTHLCKIIEVVPNRKLKYSWRYKDYEGNSFVTFELFPEGNKTRLKLTHEGLETFAQVQDLRRENFAQGWTELIGKLLPGFLEKE